MALPKVIAIVGPTSIGKTAAAIDLAEKYNGEVVTCDSVQVYAQMDIGSAKPTIEERRGIPHHMIDLVPAGGEYNAAQYAVDAAKVIKDILARGKWPIIAGGTGLFLRTLLHGIIEAPEADQALRAELENAEKAEPGYLRRRLMELDPPSAETIIGNNIPRLIRSIEITLLSGKPASLWRAEHAFKEEPFPGTPVIMLDAESTWLHERLTKREQGMVDSGLREEIQNLWQAGVSPEWRVWNALTYRQACDYLKGKIKKEELLPALVNANWAFVRRQRTWFRKEKNVIHIDVTGRPEQAARLIAEAVSL